MKMLVTGTSGQLAQSLLEAGLAAGINVEAVRRPRLDLAVPASVRHTILDVRPDIVVNAAAYTAVDKAESEPELALAINATGAGVVAETAERLSIPVIHLSTDYVFDGTKSGPYVETDATAPTSAYGRSKLAGERAVAAACSRHVILRTSWVHSPFGANFVRTMLRLAAERPELRVVDDQHGCPTYAPHLAAAILAIANQMTGTAADDGRWGIYHAAGGGETTWYGFAREVIRLSAARGGKSVPVHAIATADYPTPAKRPVNSRLECGKLERAFGARLPEWPDGAAACVARLVAAQG